MTWSGDMETPLVPYAFDKSDAEASISRLAAFLFPDDPPRNVGELGVTAVSEGTTNMLFKVVRLRASVEFSKDERTVDTVLIKVYGDGTSITIDRNKLVFHRLLSDHQLAPSLLVQFLNGHAYRFLPGKACSSKDIAQHKIWHGVARELAKWHTFLPKLALDHSTILQQEPNVWSTAKKWINALPTRTQEQLSRKGSLEVEFEYLVQRLLPDNNRQYSQVLGHGDLLCGNIILQNVTSEATPQDDVTVKFIDYEHATYCPREFDLANHFAEWAGFDCNYDLLPTISIRREFIREYVVTCHRLQGAVPTGVDIEGEVEELFNQVDMYRGFPGFYWGLCALIQAEAATGSIDFDYARYAEKRLLEYRAWRGEDEATRLRPNEPMPLREVRWASK